MAQVRIQEAAAFRLDDIYRFVTILHERMHQIDRLREDFGLGTP